MRWKDDKRGDERTRSVFLWYSVSVNGESRWLEWAEIVEVYWLGSWFEVCWGDDPNRESLLTDFKAARDLPSGNYVIPRPPVGGTGASK
jgi:hypothetical protein